MVKVSDAMIEAGRSVPMSFNGCALPDKDLIAVYLAMKAKEESADPEMTLCSHAGSCEQNAIEHGGAFCANLPDQPPR